MEFDDILETVGGFGRYQKWLLFLVCISGVPNGFILLDSVFILGVPEHRCALPGYDNDTYLIKNGDHQELVDRFIPSSNDEPNAYDKCQVIKFRDLAEDTDQLPKNVTLLTRCTKWVYDKTVFQETFVTKMDLVCDKSIWVANAGMILYLGMMVGSIVGGIISDRFGRKLTYMMAIAVRTISAVVNCWSGTIIMFVAMQFIKGGAVIVTYLSGYILVMELVGKSHRNFSGIFLFLNYTCGLIILGSLAYGLRHWFWIQLICALPGFLFLSFWWLLPESPRWLLLNNRKSEAEAILMKIAKWNRKSLQLKESLTIHHTTTSSKTGILVIFSNRALCLRSFLVFFSWMICSFIYFGLSLNSGKLGTDVYINFAFLALVEFPAYFAIVLIGDRVGRRKMFSLCMLIAGIACLSTILIGQYAAHVPYLTIILASIGKLCVTIAFVVIYLYSAELFPTVVRNAAMGIASLSARAGVLIAPYLVVFGNAVGGQFGHSLPLIVFGGSAILSSCLVLLLPETLNKSLPDSVSGDEEDSTITVA